MSRPLLKTLAVAAFLCFSINPIDAELKWVEKANFGGEARHRAIGFSVGGCGGVEADQCGQLGRGERNGTGLGVDFPGLWFVGLRSDQNSDSGVRVEEKNGKKRK